MKQETKDTVKKAALVVGGVALGVGAIKVSYEVGFLSGSWKAGSTIRQAINNTTKTFKLMDGRIMNVEDWANLVGEEINRIY